MPILISYYDSAMKIHELLTPEAIRLDFAPSPGQELNALISLACSRVSAATSEACHFQEDELHLMHGYLREGFGILNNLSERARENLVEEMELLGPTRMSSVEEARAGIVKAIRHLEESGQIVIRRDGEDEYV